jgi:serine/threonine protein kinase
MDPNEAAVFLSETLVGRYRPRSLIGAGYFCGTFLADDEASGGEVAAKILRLQHASAPMAVQEFDDEVSLLRRLESCDRVVTLLNSGRQTVILQHPATGIPLPMETRFAILELAAGSLADLVLGGPVLGWPDRLRLYRDVVKGVHQMHLQRIVHRDIKADNSLVFERPARAVVADLGRSHDTREAPRFAFEEYLHGRGDLRFAPLEFLWLQGTQEPDDQALADVYLLGSLLFEIATGVGATSMIAPSPRDVLNHMAALPPAAREVEWRAQIPWLREAARPVQDTFAHEVPPVIRARATTLFAQLTDPNPARRLPGFGGARRAVTPWDLQWLLERIDGLRRAIDPALRTTYLAGRRGARPHARKP